MSQLNGYLNVWDEQFHALVAKHMMLHPFRPTLYEHPLLPYDYTQWDKNYIWVHKQPMALWLMALSMKLFGLNVVAMRLPMVLMGTLAVYAVYRMGKIILNERLAYISALLLAINGFLLYMASGCLSTDHVDHSLFAFTTFSLWAWFEYRNSGKTKWFILIALFSACAALSKSLIGMLVFPAWLIAILSDKAQRGQLRNYLHLGIALAVAMALWLPWQLWINYAFPQEAHYESHMVTRHLFESIERAPEPLLFYFNRFYNLYFDYAIFLVPIGFVLLYRRCRQKDLTVFVFAAALITYLVFTLATTKMEAYVMPCMSAIVVSLGMVFYELTNYIGRKTAKQKLIYFLFLSILSGLYLNISYNKGLNAYKEKKDYYDGLEMLSRYYKKIKPEVEGYVVLNVPIKEMPVPLMFFTQATAAYASIPTAEECQLLKKQGYKIAVYDSPDLPTEIKSDPGIKKLQFQLN
jgi:4-amino-4-deoxy-L-arabinose transferase